MTIHDSLVFPAQNSYPVSITGPRDRALQQIARSIKQDEPALTVLSPYAPDMHGDILDAPSLVIEDHGSIRLFEHSGNEAYSYRALLLAGDGDLIAIGTSRQQEFEAYCRDYLGLGSPQVLVPEPAGGDDSLATCCRKDTAFVAKAVAHAEAHGGLNILPYMGTWPVWELAGTIARRCGAPLRVIAPPPQVTRRVNDKIWFAQLLQAMFGPTSIPPTREADNFSRLCRLALELANTHAGIAIRLPNSASSAGNLVLEAAALRAMSLQAGNQQQSVGTGLDPAAGPRRARGGGYIRTALQRSGARVRRRQTLPGEQRLAGDNRPTGIRGRQDIAAPRLFRPLQFRCHHRRHGRKGRAAALGRM